MELSSPTWFVTVLLKENMLSPYLHKLFSFTTEARTIKQKQWEKKLWRKGQKACNSVETWKITGWKKNNLKIDSKKSESTKNIWERRKISFIYLFFHQWFWRLETKNLSWNQSMKRKTDWKRVLCSICYFKLLVCNNLL